MIGGFAGTLAGGDFSVAANAAAIALDYNMMPTLLDEACREYYGLTEAALDAKDTADLSTKGLKRSGSERTLAALDALERYDALKESAYGREYVREQEREGLTREQVAQTAYEMAEQDIALNASWKVFKGEELSSYEQGVRNDFLVAQGFSFVVGRVGGPLAVSAVSKPVAKLVAKGLKSAKPAVKIKAAEMEDMLRKPKTSEQSWTIREGQEWKTKVYGKAQVTGGKDVVAGEAHAFRSYREAINAAKKEDVSEVFLNRGVRKATGHPIAKPNTRPDVTIRRAGGRIDQVEVRSRTDQPKDLRARMDATESRLPASMQGGKKDLVEFTTEVPK